VNSIQPEDSALKNSAPSTIRKPVVNPSSITLKKPGSENNSSLTNLNSLAEEARNTSDDIRPEAVQRAQALLKDPDWLSDYNIDGLANKLIDAENL